MREIDTDRQVYQLAKSELLQAIKNSPKQKIERIALREMFPAYKDVFDDIIQYMAQEKDIVYSPERLPIVLELCKKPRPANPYYSSLGNSVRYIHNYKSIAKHAKV